MIRLKVKANRIIIVPETHWDREWYIPFQEYRARLVLMMDKLLSILNKDPNYANFTFDGQTIPIEDYLEVKPEKKELIKRFVQEHRLSIGPFYVLPDEFLISGESLIRNLIIGHKIAREFGRVMKTGYIPDPFGHIAQLPQILSGFEIPSVIFWRGFGDEFEKLNLNMEFKWNSPGKAASILAIHLIMSYGSVADLNTSTVKGKYKSAIRRIKNVVSTLEKYTATPLVVLNNGSDHHEAVAEIPEIVREWNEQFPDKELVQNDFEYYVNEVLKTNPKLKEFMGELRGGKYAHLLSGVFSARMWIKQRNTWIEYLYEKYSEPFSTMVWALDKSKSFEYPSSYLLTGLKWLIKNHPHDSICGCSIDQVHDEMKTRFDWAEQIGMEILKNSILFFIEFVKMTYTEKNHTPLLIINPLPWKRKDIVKFNMIAVNKGGSGEFPQPFRIIDNSGKEIEFQGHRVEEEPRYTQEPNCSNEVSFIADIPPCGYRIYYLDSKVSPEKFKSESNSFGMTLNSIENQFYRIEIQNDGIISLKDKMGGKFHESIIEFEDVGDWGDEYDFSGPKENQTDMKYSSRDAIVKEIIPYIDGLSQKTMQIKMMLRLPVSLSEDRYNRSLILIENEIELFISLYENIKRIDFRIKLINRSMDHRLRVLFPTLIKANKVHADGHFYVNEREVEITKESKWVQDPFPTNHQKDFLAVDDSTSCHAVLNKGLPEYEAIQNEDDTITLAVTLLRCIGWLSRGDFETRKSNAGPDLKTPGAQCIGSHEFELSLIIADDGNWLSSEIPSKAKEFNVPLKPFFPTMIDTPIRVPDKIFFGSLGLLSYFIKPKVSQIEPYLNDEFSFIEIKNKKILLSALKKSENDDSLIIRFYNISDTLETSNIQFNDLLEIQSVELVNYLEQKPMNPIKANYELLDNHTVNIQLHPHVVATFKFGCSLK